MKHTRRIASLLLALVMVFAMATTAFAVDITINDGDVIDTASYAAYKLLNATDGGDGKFAYTVNAKYKDILANVFELSGTEGDPVTDADIMAEINKITNDTAQDFADKVYKAIIAYNAVDGNTDITADYTATSNVFSSVDQGYYMIVETATDSDTGADNGQDVFSLVMLDTAGKDNITVNTKEEIPTLEKKIVEDSTSKDVNDVAIGDTVSYELIGTYSDQFKNYETYKYVFHDDLSAGLDFNNDVKVYYRVTDESGTTTDTEIASTLYAVVSGETLDHEATATFDCDFEVAFTDLKNVTNLPINAQIIVKYSATVNEEAAVNIANSNDAYLEYANKPIYSPDGTTNVPTGVTPEDSVESYVTEVILNKIDGYGTALKGATFKVTGEALNKVIVTKQEYVAATVDENGTHWKLNDGTYTTDDPNTEGIDETKYADTQTKYLLKETTETVTTSETVNLEEAVGEDGKLKLTGLKEGTYTFSETVVPAGYNKIADFTLVITFDETTKSFAYDWSIVSEGDTASVNVVNQSGSELPSTGGMGTTLFYVVGGLMVAAAVVLLVTKKRMAAAE